MIKKYFLASGLFAAVFLLSASLAFAQSSCVRGNPSLSDHFQIVSGTGYQVSSSTDATVSVRENSQLGTGTYIFYDFFVTNQDPVSCGSTSQYLIDVFGTGVGTNSLNGHDVPNFVVMSVRNPDGTIVNNPGNTINLQAGIKQSVIRVKVQAAQDLSPSVKGFGVVTIRVTNVASGKTSDGSGTITLSQVSECVQKNPTVSIAPPGGRSGLPGDQLDFLVTVTDQDIGGCSPRQFSITQAGVQDLAQLCTSSGCLKGTIADPNDWRWTMAARFMSNGVVTEREFGSGGQGNTFTAFGTAKYLRFTPTFSSLRFALGPSDDFQSGTTTCKYCVKNFILKVTSYSGDDSNSPRSIAFCVDQSSVCGFTVYTLGSRSSVTDAGLGITDDKLNRPEATLSGGITGSGGTSAGGSVSSGGSTTGGATVPAGIDQTFYNACRACALQPKKGFDTETNQCLNGNVQGSVVNSGSGIINDGIASIDRGNWVYFPLQTARNNIVKDSVRQQKSSSCDSPPSGSGSSSSSTTAGSPTTCLSCVTSQPNMGWDLSLQKCEKGSILASVDSSASAANNNWIVFSTEARKSQVVAALPSASAAFSCENPPKSSSTTVAPTTCLDCVRQTGMGFNTVTQKCEKGSILLSVESPANAADKNWISFSTEARKSQIVALLPSAAAAFSCEKPPQ